ncbi:MAG: translocation/assembly module TamB [Candidatus Thiodiazotropha sp. (ex Monitilora ramsayi)]|nr:translocation/assembly module TamB [Candidatus Thiodiazotropha sp. (ex Monitilora ramsayi)]
MSAVRILRYLLYTLTVLVVTLLIGIAFLLYSQSAARWLFALVDELTPYAVSVEAVEGRLAGPLSVHRFSLTDGEMRFDLAEMKFDWQPAALLKGDLHVTVLKLQEIDVTLPSETSAEEKPEKSPFAGVNLPINLQIDQLWIDEVTISDPDGSEGTSVDSLILSAHSERDRINIEQLSVEAFSTQLNVTGNLHLSAGVPMTLSLDWRHQMHDGPELTGRGEIKGDLAQLHLVQDLDAPLSSRLEAELYNLETDPQWEANLELKESELDWLIDYPLRISGNLESRGKPESMNLLTDLTAWQPDYGEVSLAMAADYRQKRITAQSLRLTTPSGVKIEGQGEYLLDDAMGRFSSQLKWQDLRWPLQGERVQVRSPQGSLSVTGRPEDYQYTLELEALSPGQPATRVEAAGQGDLQGLKLKTLVANLVEGVLTGSGDLAWRPEVKWQLTLEGNEINPVHWQQDLPGRLNLSLATQGQLGEDGLRAEINLKALQGVLRDYPVKADSLVTVEGEQLNIQSLQLLSGDNRIEASGSVGEELALDWQVDATDLAAFWPDLQGQLVGAGRLSGPAVSPRVEAKLDGQHLGLGSNKAETLRLEADLSLAAEQALALSLHMDGLSAGTQAWEQLALDLSGAIPKHRLDLRLTGSGAPQTAIKLEAGWSDASVWSGSLEQLTLNLPEMGEWNLSQAADFSLSAEQQRVDTLCLESQGGNLCASYSAVDGKGWEGKASARAFPLVVLQPWLPNGLQISGTMELDSQLKSEHEGRPVGNLSVKLPEVIVGLDLSNEAERVTISGGKLNASLDSQGAGAKLMLPLLDLGEIAGRTELPGFSIDSDDWRQQSVTGQLSVKVGDLSRVSLFSPKLQNVRGRIEGDVGLDGVLGNPKVTGGAELIDGALDIPELGLELREFGVQVKSQSQAGLGLSGSFKSGQGRLRLDGKLELNADTGFPLQLTLKGNELTVANIPEAEVHVSPDIRFERSGKVASLKGEIQIPFARIRPRSLPESAVSSSPDLVVVSSDTPEPEEQDVPLSTELRIVFGDRVSFDGFGLRGKLTGRLLVIDEPKRSVIGRGRVGIRDGTYRAYGQDLKIERGFALFVDSPIDNPGLDVRAIREVDDVTVGIRVSGTLKLPKVDLFSSPSMSGSDTLTYLITGRPPGESGGQSVGIAAALSATGAGSVANELGRQLGLDELRVDAGSSLEAASVVAGTYLSPKLYLQYINELASRETKLRMRYDINKRLQLEAETGKSQAGDLYYTFDR